MSDFISPRVWALRFDAQFVRGKARDVLLKEADRIDRGDPERTTSPAAALRETLDRLRGDEGGSR